MGIIVLFAIGAGIGGNLSANYGIHMIWVSCGLLIVSFLLMFLDIEAREAEHNRRKIRDIDPLSDADQCLDSFCAAILCGLEAFCTRQMCLAGRDSFR